MRVRIDQRLEGDRGDVVGIDKCLPPPLGTVIVSLISGKWASVKFCMTQAGRRMEWVNAVRLDNSSSTARISISGGIRSLPYALR